MNYLIKSAFRVSFWSLVGISLIGFIVGISLYVFYIWINPNIEIAHLDMLTIRSIWGIMGIEVAKFIKIVLIITICLLTPSLLYGVVVSKVLVLSISVYFGFIFLFFINASDYLTVFYLSIQGLSGLWCLSIGTLKISIIEKFKLATIPFLIISAIGICQVFI